MKKYENMFPLVRTDMQHTLENNFTSSVTIGESNAHDTEEMRVWWNFANILGFSGNTGSA